ncbi:MAG: signal peptidase I [Eggerthellaceae bacterium]|nr:signal peptidase I [Eggerthellaceae bacterium]
MEPGEHAERTKSGGAVRSFLSVLIMVALVAVITVLLRMFVFVPYEIPSGSMEDTIQPGNMVFSEKISYYLRSPEYGDIVTFNDPQVAGRTLIKRVIATGGQQVNLIDGVVYVDGEKLDEPYTDGKPSYPLDRTAGGMAISYPYIVPEGEVWVMGDNRTSSQDSRYFGSVKLTNVTGRAALIYWPLNDVGIL